MNRIAVLISGILFLLCLAGTQAIADGVTIEKTSTGVFTITLRSASVVEVLRTLESKYRIEVHGLDDVADTDPVSASYTGKLPDILGRLLRNQNFSIVRSNTYPTGVAKIYIAVTKAPSEKSTPAPPTKSSGD